MIDWLAPVADALERRVEPCPIFFRDDDAGWDDDALLALLDEFQAAGVAPDVAAIPTALSHAAARSLAERVDAGLVHVHQHGYAHVDHEPAGRKCEFGPARTGHDQERDLRAGRERLEHVLGQAIEPIFTPPWNRCTPSTVRAALRSGHRVLSRDHTAGELDLLGLTEVRVDVDWARCGDGTPEVMTAVGLLLAARIAAGEPVGVMLHHETIDATGRRLLRRLLDLVGGSPGAECTSILGLAGPAGRRRAP